jgi:hypothetical protein
MAQVKGLEFRWRKIKGFDFQWRKIKGFMSEEGSVWLLHWRDYYCFRWSIMLCSRKGFRLTAATGEIAIAFAGAK